ncbi:unnamed protein product [Prunus armeniaca]
MTKRVRRHIVGSNWSYNEENTDFEQLTFSLLPHSSSSRHSPPPPCFNPPPSLLHNFGDPFEPSSFPRRVPTSLSRRRPRSSSETGEKLAGFIQFSQPSISVVRPPNRTIKDSGQGRSKNKSGSKWGVLPKLGVWADGLEFFRPPEISQATQAAVGSLVGTTLSFRMILVFSRACRNSRISIRTSFEC